MPYTRGEMVPEPASRRSRAQAVHSATGKSAVEDHFAKAQALEPQALEKLKGGDMYEALQLFTQVKKELADAVYAAGPGALNYSMLQEASAATQQNIDFINGFLPYEFLMDPRRRAIEPGGQQPAPKPGASKVTLEAGPRAAVQGGGSDLRLWSSSFHLIAVFAGPR
eukprot:CAMPEP_0179036422 /NCGR_PEP_ID=MMETSP0796-20121207/13609_1 /TAXON_ID=73915 /ORGANISM="Pyrodinium bahamense, Strain pbaha01" /LENGTH=166 /DNA_ID=CAMNT_0020732707 /DNA_START=66 /DNA_END=563 /DNA_ORIENTATION=+